MTRARALSAEIAASRLTTADGRLGSVRRSSSATPRVATFKSTPLNGLTVDPKPETLTKCVSTPPLGGRSVPNHPRHDDEQREQQHNDDDPQLVGPIATECDSLHPFLRAQVDLRRACGHRMTSIGSRNSTRSQDGRPFPASSLRRTIHADHGPVLRFFTSCRAKPLNGLWKSISGDVGAEWLRGEQPVTLRASGSARGGFGTAGGRPAASDRCSGWRGAYRRP
jgi:hypothetical protein